MIFKKLVKLKMKKIRKWSLMLKLCLYFTINVEDTLWHIKKNIFNYMRYIATIKKWQDKNK